MRDVFSPGVLAEHALDLEGADLAPRHRGRGVDQLALARQERLVGEALRPRLPPAMRERIVGAGRDPARRSGRFSARTSP